MANISSDDKGKLYELRFMFSLNNGVTPKHFRSEEQSPESVQSRIAERTSADVVDTIDRHADQAAKIVLERLGDRPIDVVWTSQPGDIFNVTGETDENNTADVVIILESGAIGLSLKYGSSRSVNLKNCGYRVLENHSGASFAEHMNRHYEFLNSLGVKTHAEFKQLQDTTIASSIKQSSIEMRRAMAADYATGFKDSNNERIIGVLTSMAAASTTMKLLRVQTHVSKSGSAKHKVIDPREDIDSVLSKYSKFSVEHTGGVNVYFCGDGKSIARLNFHSSGKPTRLAPVGILTMSG